MSDKELLELAVKAAGLQEHGWMGDSYCHVVDNTWATFDPLTDDGDALRLAVKLEINVCYDGLDAVDRGGCGVVTKDGRKFFEPTNGNSNAATRRAIVRAAAEIGKDL